MPNAAPIIRNSINENMLPKYLLPEPEKEIYLYGNQEKQALKNTFAKELGLLDSQIGENTLLAHSENEPIRNDLKMKIADYYNRSVDQFDPAIWHIIRFDTKTFYGSQSYPYTANNEAFFRVGIPGRYHLTCHLRIYYISSGDLTKYEAADVYAPLLATSFPTEDYLLDVYDHKAGTSIERIGMFPMISYYPGIPVLYPRNIMINFNSETSLKLESNNEIDLRVNFLSYNMGFYPNIRFEGYCTLHLINEDRVTDFRNK